MRVRAVWAALLLVACGSCRRASRTDKVLGPMARDAAPVAVILPPDAGPPLDTVPEREPNDSPGQANKLESPKPVLGHLVRHGREADRDYFALEVPEGAGRQVLWLQLRPPVGLRVALEVRTHPSYERIAYRRGAKPGSSVTIPNLALEPGRYYIGVKALSGQDDGHPYVLSWKLAPWQEGQEIEPNDERGRASPLSPGQDTVGYFGRAKDTDWYKISGGGPTRVYNLVLEGVRGVRTELAVANSRGVVLIARRSRTGRRVSIHGLAGPSDPFYVRVRAVAGSNCEDAYLLRVEEAPAGPGTELEPNDTVATAMLLPGVQGSLSGLIESRQDRDVFRIAVSRPQNLRLEVHPDEKLDVVLEVLGAKGKVVQRADAGGPGYVEIFPDIPVRAKDRYVQIRKGRRGARSGHYTLRWRMWPMDKGDEAEPNDRPGQATRILPGVSARGYIYPPGDRDWFWFEFPGVPGNTVRVRISAQGLPKVHLRIRLLDGMRNVLAEAVRQSAAGQRKIELNLHVAKRYYIEVDDDSGRRANASDTYELELVKLW